MGIHKKTTIDGKVYVTEVWLSSTKDGIYKFGIQAFPRQGTPHSFSARLSEEFIEDEIDNDKNKDYLEKVCLKVAENHLKDMLKMSFHAVTGNLTWWFREAKEQINKEVSSE